MRNSCEKDCILDFPPVLTKKDMVRRYKAGEFGNASPTWNTLAQFEEYAFPSFGEIVKGSFHLRSRIAGGATHYNMTPLEIAMTWRHGVDDKSQWYVSEMAPHEHGTIQGEVQQGPEGLMLFYASAKLPMRDALRAEGRQVYGIMALGLLKQYMCARSYDWMMILLERYPGHVVEFTSFSVEWGTLPGYNTVYWEVRGGY